MLANLPVLAAVAVFVWIAWHDLRALTIRNRTVLVLIGLYLLHAALSGFETWQGDLAAGVILFLVGFVMWLAKAMGAGDVKLLFAIGLFVGFLGLAPFAVLLLVFSTLLLVAIKLAARRGGGGPISARLARMAVERKVPYGLPLTLAALPVMIFPVCCLA